jgi:hypothetical protein
MEFEIKNDYITGVLLEAWCDFGRMYRKYPSAIIMSEADYVNYCREFNSVQLKTEPTINFRGAPVFCCINTKIKTIYIY